ncbi:MAG: hypothetical protein JRJ54_14270 [Deltaproteobacteria bacterium]|nr:hypothetical protein [Deltaproteobacteria bacterium]
MDYFYEGVECARMDKKAVKKLHAKNVEGFSEDGSGIGLRNIKQRLEHAYGQGCKMKIKTRPQHGTAVQMNIPRSSPVWR